MADPVLLPAPERLLWMWALVAAVVLAAGVATERWIRGRKKAIAADPVRTPEEIAYAEMEALLKAKLPEQGLIVDFYVRLTGIVRRYIERTTGIHAPEQTTEEFLRAMHGDARFDSTKTAQLKRFLEASDLVKYAAQRPEAKDVEDAFKRAQEFVGLNGGGLISSSHRGSGRAGNRAIK
jgi:hypothetical protein